MIGTVAIGTRMAVTGIAVAAMSYIVAATTGKTNAATGTVPTGTIATEMTRNLVPIKETRDMAGR